MKQLILTTSRPGFFGSSGDPLCDTDKYAGEVIKSEIKGDRAYLHDEIQSIAGYDIPIFLSGDMKQLDLPVNEQDILVVLDKEYQCIAELQTEKGWDTGAYYITLKTK